MKIKSAIFLLLFFILLPYALLAQEPQPEGIVAQIFDGDTVKLMDRRIVRIAGIDSPELKHGKSSEQFYARISQQELNGLLEGKHVRVREVSEKGKDRYGRIVADLECDDGRSVAEEMIRRGAAFFYFHKDLSPLYQERLLQLQRSAIEERAGMWNLLLEHPIARENYVGNRESRRFFPADCPNAHNIKPRWRVYFGTLMDAFLAGYSPARVCLFWPDASIHGRIPD